MPPEVLDQSRDLNGQETYRLLRLYPPPEWVKEASADAICGLDLPSHLYAAPDIPLYPTHTKAATWLSYAFFLDRRDCFPVQKAASIQDRLLKAAAFNGALAACVTLAETHRKQAHDDLAQLHDDEFAYVGTGPDGQLVRRLPLRNAREVKAAAEYLETWRDKIPLAECRPMAVRVLEKAARYGAGLGGATDERLEKTAGFGSCGARDAIALVRDRSHLLRQKGQAELAGEFEKLAEELARLPAEAVRAPTQLAKLADLIDQADRVAGVRYAQGEAAPPEDTLFAITKRAVSSMLTGHVQVPSGSIYDRDDLSRLRVSQVRDHLGSELANAITSDGLTVDAEKAAEVLPTMPRRDAEAFDRMAAQCGLFPAIKEAATRRTGLTALDLANLAALHQAAL